LQLCDVKDATQQGKKKGDTYHWDVFSDVSTQGTTLTETKTMPETPFVITQGTLTVDEFGELIATLLSHIKAIMEKRVNCWNILRAVYTTT